MTTDITTPCCRSPQYWICEGAMDELLITDEPLVGQLDESLDDVALSRRVSPARRGAGGGAAGGHAGRARRSNRRRCSTLWPRKCVGACGADHRRTVALRNKRRNYAGGRRLPSCRACQVAGGYSHADRGQHPRHDGAAHRPARADRQLREHCRGPSPHGCVRWASARRWEFRSSSTAACGAWRRSVPHEPGPMPADTEMRISRFAELIATARGGRIPR